MARFWGWPVCQKSARMPAAARAESFGVGPSRGRRAPTLRKEMSSWSWATPATCVAHPSLTAPISAVGGVGAALAAALGVVVTIRRR